MSKVFGTSGTSEDARQHVLAGKRGSMNGPYNVLLRSPEMGDLAQKLGAYIRFHTTVPTKLNEFAILITARALNVQYEWAAHHKYALQAGLTPAVIDAVAVGKRPSSMQPDEEIVSVFCPDQDTAFGGEHYPPPPDAKKLRKGLKPDEYLFDCPRWHLCLDTEIIHANRCL